MPGCKDKCYIYEEYHNLSNVTDKDKQIKIEREIEKYNKGEDCNLLLLEEVILRKCLGNYRKDTAKLRKKCIHYWKLSDNLSTSERIGIWDTRRKKFWRIISFILVVLSIILTYLQFSKPSCESIEEENKILKIKLEKIKKQNKNINNQNLILEVKT